MNSGTPRHSITLIKQHNWDTHCSALNGGYFLARSPKEISIGEIVRALEDDMEIIYTYLGNRCNHERTVKFIKSGYDMSVIKEYLSKKGGN